MKLKDARKAARRSVRTRSGVGERMPACAYVLWAGPGSSYAWTYYPSPDMLQRAGLIVKEMYRWNGRKAVAIRGWERSAS